MAGRRSGRKKRRMRQGRRTTAERRMTRREGRASREPETRVVTTRKEGVDQSEVSGRHLRSINTLGRCLVLATDS